MSEQNGFHQGLGDAELPVGGSTNAPQFGSDVVAKTIRDLGIDFIALTPGASFRGLHDSLVNYLGNQNPKLLLCVHEEHAVALAHGYAKVTERAMAVAIHSNVGLMHAAMAVFNAWCDRMPVLAIGATGPVDADQRRPWIDWIHTARDQGALIRHYIKWDDQPASPAAAREAVIRAKWLAESLPRGPVYINLDSELQERELDGALPELDVQRYTPQTRADAGANEVARLHAGLGKAKNPILLIGRASRSPADWRCRVRVAERYGAKVLTDLRTGAVFPTDHPLHAAPPATFPSQHAKDIVAESDFIVSFDWIDLAGIVSGDPAPITHVSLDHRLHNGWSMDHCGLAPVDRLIEADPDSVMRALDDLSEAPKPRDIGHAPRISSDKDPLSSGVDTLLVRDIATHLAQAVGDRPVSLLHVPISWEGHWWHFRHPLDYLGADGGGGVGAGPGIGVGAALALRGSGRLPVAICGDGDFAMGSTAIWTAVHYRIPVLFIVANNHSFFNDEVHQERMAVRRGRRVENKWIGQRMSDPEIDMACLGEAQGAQSWGNVRSAAQLARALREGIDAVENGKVAVIDVHVATGYPDVTKSALTKK